MTINEALVWMKTLQTRHSELIGLRNENSVTTTRYLGAHADKSIEKTPVYDVKVLDRLVARLGREMRKLEQQIKATNAVTPVLGYEADETVLGELE